PGRDVERAAGAAMEAERHGLTGDGCGHRRRLRRVRLRRGRGVCALGHSPILIRCVGDGRVVRPVQRGAPRGWTWDVRACARAGRAPRLAGMCAAIAPRRVACALLALAAAPTEPESVTMPRIRPAIASARVLALAVLVAALVPVAGGCHRGTAPAPPPPDAE